MCGIAGILNSSQSGDTLLANARRMADTLVHRGPDDNGVWMERDQGLALAHRRLSILDLSQEGHQPMASACGRYRIVFNGEIYNHATLRNELEHTGVTGWHGHSDTEVMLAAIATWGIPAALERFSGMFAFALWDRETRSLTLARDRVGEKPLYYGYNGKLFLFGSELKALRAHPDFKSEINRHSLALMQRLAYIPAPYSIYQGIHKLPPGTLLTIQPGHRVEFRPESYWSARRVAEQGQHALFNGTEEEALDTLEHLLSNTISQQMIADVPLGAFLSGGVDSSITVALMQVQSSRPVKSFTIGFWEDSFNEAENAKAVATHLGTDHTELYISPKQALDVIPLLPELYDEPYGDSSQIPTYLVSQLARQQVTVSLSGDGGDELFGGYNRYHWVKQLWHKLSWAPVPLRRVLANRLTALSPTTWDRIFNALRPVTPVSLRHQNPGDKVHKLAQIVAACDPEEIYWSLVSLWKDPEVLVLDSHEPVTVFTDPTQRTNLAELEHRMMLMDTLTYLPDDIMVKVDRAAMGVSLETRLPLLDHKLLEFAWSLPLEMKIRGNEQKYLLRKLLYRHVPASIIERPKMGFGIPLADWLRGPLRDWSEALLDERRLGEEGYFNPAMVQRYWKEHLSGQHNWSYHLWNVLTFQAWHDTSPTKQPTTPPGCK
ncbi:MAG: asparagine synthase (glutamine-hydrolyzing) [Candidatus Thiodiazotropha sp. (ex Lucinoma aequizonata)]|nr:asparagine synthase (glutamine-hydrolyzing) [Candidatus Thiodiazotropha sp. (ex Lucinoma aequizonata)]MCU7888834.1 asparagine synthase (glutamine-hydrolyzing) [Candidatus Thiodiazotropha sp. (ex Lucinoma aequizonata)]MCU7895928.1 asparagine synthase (glutamine-hydrolyzing) [Candidatus Thiodiazotropha sp. (ex Lucinoma aequizonata)]MCU7899245.1 asparagine synthase (glutamine-hydrolyzing) [Candidatus Thiodiazotropha sp. (ex Lucinoma aequizonata)]MCU7902798.1 asparagine synthase (glutamine-hydro